MPPHVCILMGTLNGAAHLPAQLTSLAAQSHHDWSLHVSDDGSSDSSCRIVDAFAAAHPERLVRRYTGPRQGSAANFMSLLARDTLPENAWVALSDQDDVWFPDRLQHALHRLHEHTGDRPRCYASRTLLTDADLSPRAPSRHRPHPPAFGNALVQNVLAGNTLVLDPAAVSLLRRSVPAALQAGVAHHDWWIYLVMTGAGGQVVNDDRPGLYYRQHARNLLGANRGPVRAFRRLNMILDGRYQDWLHSNLTALHRIETELTAENRTRLRHFEAWLQGNGRSRCGGGLAQIGVWRQNRAEALMLRFAALLGRL